MRTKHCFVVTLGLLAFGSVWAVGLTNLVPGKSPSGVKAADVDSFLQGAHQATALVQTSASNLALAVASKEDQAKIQALIDANKKAESAQEKESTAKELLASDQAVLKKTDFENGEEVKAASKDETRKKAIANSGYDLALGLLKDKLVADQGKDLVSKVGSDITLASKLGSIKDAVAATGDQMSGLGSVSMNLPKLFAKIGVDAKLPTSASDPPKETASF
jgi:hypothetical protein